MMRKFLSAIGVLVAMMFSICLTSQANMNQFVGAWANVDAATRGITRLEIRQSASTTTVQAWGSAGAGESVVGTAGAVVYAPNVSSNPIATASAMSAVITTSFSSITFIIHPGAPNRLSLEVLTKFTDGSGRSNYADSYQFQRTVAATPALVAPQQLQPANGVVYSHYPRGMGVAWRVVPGAASYTVEVDFSTGTGVWASTQGTTYILAPNIETNQYSFNFVGAQPGRWRVWAVGANGVAGPKSPWWMFTFTR